MAPDGSTVRRAEDLDFQACLGRGFFGEVWRARARQDGGAASLFAVKKVKLSLIDENRLRAQLRREIAILYSLEHPRIIRLHFDFDDGSYMYLGMEFAVGGTLFDKLNSAGKFAPEQAARYFWDTCEALEYLHHLPEKVIHRDIKPENILLDGEDRVKLADFGWANMIDGMTAGKRDTFCGTLDYLPPEMIMGTGHNESADMWNMGVLLYEMTTGQSPFGSNSKETTCRLILKVDLKFPADINADARDLVLSLCRKKPAERLSARAALKHRFLAKFHPETRSAAAAAAPAGGDGPPCAEGRPSVIARHLRSERDRVGKEIQQLLDAKQSSEDALARVAEDLDQAHELIREEQRRNAELEVLCEELASAGSTRELELDELKKKAQNLQAEVAKTGRGGGGWWLGRRTNRGGT